MKNNHKFLLHVFNTTLEATWKTCGKHANLWIIALKKKVIKQILHKLSFSM